MPCNFLENCQGGCAEVSTVFINPDIYWDRMFWESLQSSCCSSRPAMENTLRKQVQAGGMSLAFQANICLDF